MNSGHLRIYTTLTDVTLAEQVYPFDMHQRDRPANLLQARPSSSAIMARRRIAFMRV